MPKQRVKLLIVSEVLTGGGAERLVSTLLTHLDRSRFDPHLCLLRDEVSYSLPSDVPVSVLGGRGKLTIPRSVKRLRDRIASESPGVILTAVSYIGHFVAAALRPLENKPIWISRIGDNWGDNPTARYHGWRRLAFNFLINRDLPLADRIVANSEGLAKTLVQYYPDTDGRVTVLETPCDFEALDRLAAQAPARQAASDKPLVMSVGRLVRAKRPDVLVDAFAQLPECRSMQLWICGDGPLRAETENRIRRQGLSDQIQLLGFCDNPFALLKQASLFVLTSQTEGLPNALIEAQGLGVPAIATRCPHGPDEIVIDGETGILTPVGDAKAVADAMQRLLGDAELRTVMGETASRATRSKFGISTVLPRWQDFLLETATLAHVTQDPTCR